MATRSRLPYSGAIDHLSTSPVAIWRGLPRANQRWILIYGVAATAALNIVINAAVAWLSTYGVKRVPLWSFSGTSTISDAVLTVFLLPAITCLLSAASIRRDMYAGRLPRLRGLARRAPRLAMLPGPVLVRSLACGVAGVVVFAPVLVVLLIVTDYTHISRAEFIVVQTCFAVTLGAVVTPLIALRAMADPVPT